MLIPCQRSLYTGNGDHDSDSDCDLNIQTTSHITPSPSSVSPTQKNTTTTLQTTTTGSTTSSTEDTEQYTTPTSSTTILQSTDSGEPSETSEDKNMDILTTSTSIPQPSKDITAATETHKGSTRTTTRRGGTSSEGFNMTMFMNCTCSKACTLGIVRSSLNGSTGVEQSCTDNSAVIAGGVGGVMTLIIVSQSVIILILLLGQKKTTNSQERLVHSISYASLFSSLLYTVLALVRRWRPVAMRPMEWLNHSMRWWDCSYTLVSYNYRNSFALDNTQF